jgi:hypothetical protein
MLLATGALVFESFSVALVYDTSLFTPFFMSINRSEIFRKRSAMLLPLLADTSM